MKDINKTLLWKQWGGGRGLISAGGTRMGHLSQALEGKYYIISISPGCKMSVSNQLTCKFL